MYVFSVRIKEKRKTMKFKGCKENRYTSVPGNNDNSILKIDPGQPQ